MKSSDFGKRNKPKKEKVTVLSTVTNPSEPPSPAADKGKPAYTQDESGLGSFRKPEPSVDEMLGNTKEASKDTNPTEIKTEAKPKKRRGRKSKKEKEVVVTKKGEQQPIVTASKKILNPEEAYWERYNQILKQSEFTKPSRSAPEDTEEIHVGGLRWKCRKKLCDGDTIRSIIDGKEYDLPPEDCFNPPNVVFDLGSYIGGYAIWGVTRWNDCNAIAVEPLPENVTLIKENVEQNGLKEKIVVLQGAVGNGDSIKMEYPDPNGEGGYTHQFIGSASNLEKRDLRIYVPQVTLEQLLYMSDDRFGTSGRQIHCMKLDVEGREYEFFVGSKAEDLQRINWIVGEYHHGDTKEIDDRLLSLGFEKLFNAENRTQTVGLFLYRNKCLNR